MRKRVRTALIVLAVLTLAVVVYDGAVMMVWDGHTELTINIVVSDAETGLPIKDAEVLVYSNSPRDFDGRKQPITMKTDTEGRVHHFYGTTMVGGKTSNLGFTDTRSVRKPDWMLLVRAPGYQNVDELYLAEPKRGTTTRMGPMQDTLIVPIALYKSAR
ncbi:MAG: hypothetical protein K8U57_18685 [Planctomycetes bacterium]|nr:hypothetical protein [Planctomycetota bacterium]